MQSRLPSLAELFTVLFLSATWGPTARAAPRGYRRVSLVPGAVLQHRLQLDTSESCGSLLVTPQGSVYASSGTCEAQESAIRPSARSLQQVEDSSSRQEWGTNQSCVGCNRLSLQDAARLPFLAVGRLLGRQQGATADLECTGTLIGRRHILTAAHCVFDAIVTHTYFASLNFTQAQNGSGQPSANIPWLYARFPAAFAAQGDYQNFRALNSDFALVTLASDSGSPAWLNLSDPASSTQSGLNSSGGLTTAGFLSNDSTGSLWTASCAVTAANATLLYASPFCANNACSNLFFHNCTPAIGQSGSAMWGNDTRVKGLLIGKVLAGVGEYVNVGLSITSPVLQLIQNWYAEDINGITTTSQAATAPSSTVAYKTSFEPWRTIAVVESAAIAAACLLLLAVWARAKFRSHKCSRPPEDEDEDDDDDDDEDEDVAAAEKGRKRVPSTAGLETLPAQHLQDILDTGIFSVEGDLRSIWEEVGVLEYHHGDIFSGEMRHEQPSGYGVAQYTNGDVYAGQWIRGRQHGWGILFRLEQERVAGQWIDGAPVLVARALCHTSQELADDIAELVDLCEETARMAQAAADSAATYTKRAVGGRLHMWRGK